MLPRPVTENPGELIHAWLGVRARTTRWYHAVQKAEKVDEPLRHDSFALLAPKNRNNRNQEFEKRAGKKTKNSFFQKSSTAVRARPRDPGQSKRDGFLHTLPQPVQRNRI